MRVTFSVAHTTRDGRTHKPDTSVELDDGEAREVCHIGHGRVTPVTRVRHVPADAPNKSATKADTNKKEKANG